MVYNQHSDEERLLDDIEVEGMYEFEDIVPYISNEDDWTFEVVNPRTNELNTSYPHHPKGKYWKMKYGTVVNTQRKYNTGRFKDPEYVEWRTEVILTANFDCQKCGSKEATHCHHIKNYSDNPELRFERSNGILFCERCHTAFHNKYGRKFNDKNQIKEFLLGGV